MKKKNIYSFLIFKVLKSWLANKYTAQQTLAAKKKRCYKKCTANLNWPKDHFVSGCDFKAN